MNISLLSCLIVCPLVFLAGVIDAIGGGGGLISLPAYLLAGLPPQFAIATNKFSSSIGTAISTAVFIRRGFVALRLSLLLIASSLAGASIGARLTLHLSDEILKYGMVALLPVVAVVVLVNKNFTRKETDVRQNLSLSTLAIAAGASFVIGMYDGFYGPGTGTFLILAFFFLAKLTLPESVGYAKIVNLSSNVAALYVFLTAGRVVFNLALAAALFSIAGHFIGARIVLKNGAKFVRPVIVLVLVLLFVKVISDMTV